MNTCLYEPIHGSFPECDGKCKTGPGRHCAYYFIDEFWKIMSKWKTESRVDKSIMWKFNRDRTKMYVYTTKPGYMIGYHGSLIEKYRNLLKENGFEIEIEFVECEDCVS